MLEMQESNRRAKIGGNDQVVVFLSIHIFIIHPNKKEGKKKSNAHILMHLIAQNPIQV